MYIRTRDGVYEVTDNMTIETGTYIFFGKVYNTTEKHLFRNDNDLGEFVAQADTIEELCDEFVCEWFDKEVNRYRHVYCRFKIGQSKELYRRDIPLSANVDFEIYAGIWIKGKGLTYVAKMNKEGDLDPI